MPPNPDCGTSHNVLASIDASGETPAVIDNLRTGWTRPQRGPFSKEDGTPMTDTKDTSLG